MKRNLISILIGLTLISLIVPTSIWIRDYYTNIHSSISSSILSEYATFVSFIISFWGLVINAVLVVLAYKAFQNFDVKKQFHNKQLELVSTLSMEVSDTVLSNMMYRTVLSPTGTEHLIAEGYTFSFFEISIGFNYSKFPRMFVRSNNIENTLPFIRHRNNPLLPKDIKVKLNKLYKPLQYSLSTPKDKLPKDFVVLYGNKILDEYSKDMLYEYYSNSEEYSKDCNELKMAIVKWFQEYGATDISF